MRALRWLGRNLSAFILAFTLAVVVWISAVTSADPNTERVFIVPIQVIGQEANTEIVNDIPERMQLTLYAPRSNLDQIGNDDHPLSAWIDLSGLVEGTHNVPVQYQIPQDIRPIREISASPSQVEITIEALITTTIPIIREITGEPALGYQAEIPEWSATETVIFGKSSLVNKVKNIQVVLDISGATETIEELYYSFHGMIRETLSRVLN